MRYLVLHDVDAIQKYVLATSRLREIRGASALLDELNRRRSCQKAIEHHGEPIYFGGGSAAADFADKDSATVFCKEVSELYVNKTKTAHSTGVVVEYDETADEDAPTGFKRKLQAAHRLLRSKKVGARRETQLLTNPFFQRCQSCGIYPVSRYDEHAPEPNKRFICESCFIKRGAGDDRSEVYSRIKETMSRKHHIETELPETLEDIGNASKPKGYMGVIYADGNRMGDHLQKIKTKEALKNFSLAVDEAARETIYAMIFQRYENDLLSLFNDGKEPILPTIVPLCGGDDLLVVVPAHQALEIAIEYLEKFQKIVKQKMSDEVKRMIETDEISACAGVAIAKEATPISELFELAQSLCKMAKRRSYDIHLRERREVACLDFQVVTTPSWGDVEDTRAEQLTIKDRRLTCRPYTIDEAESLIKAVRELKGQKFPQSKLMGLYGSLWQGKHQAMLSYLTLFARAPDRQKKALKKVEEYLQATASTMAMTPPWKKVREADREAEATAYGDLVEIYQFVEAK